MVARMNTSSCVCRRGISPVEAPAGIPGRTRGVSAVAEISLPRLEAGRRLACRDKATAEVAATGSVAGLSESRQASRLPLQAGF